MSCLQCPSPFNTSHINHQWQTFAIIHFYQLGKLAVRCKYLGRYWKRTNYNCGLNLHSWHWLVWQKNSLSQGLVRIKYRPCKMTCLPPSSFTNASHFVLWHRLEASVSQGRQVPLPAPSNDWIEIMVTEVCIYTVYTRYFTLCGI